MISALNVITLILSQPVGINHLWRIRKNGKGLYSSKKYKAWIKAAGWEIVAQNKHRERISGSYTIKIEVATTSRYDVDSGAKAVLDLLKNYITDDDKHCRSTMTVKVDDVPAGSCRVTVAPWVTP